MIGFNSLGTAWVPSFEPVDSLRIGMDTSILMRVLDEIDYGVLLVDAAGGLRYANQLALSELRGGGPLCLSSGRVGAATVADQHALSMAILDAQRGRRRLFTAGHNGGSLPVAVVPMPGDDATGETLALLVLGRRSSSGTLTIDFYARSHNLTATEMNVLKHICGGLKPKDVAREQGIALSTVRSHIGNIRAKTQTGSIRELLTRVSVLPPITPAIKNTPRSTERLAVMTH